MNRRLERSLPVLFFLLAFLLRLWGIADNAGLRGDEGFQVPGALHYVETGHSEPDNWIHPPLKHLLLSLSIGLWGNTPYGWRMVNVILGALTVPALFLLGRKLFDGVAVAGLAALFLALDPLHLFYSRSNFQEIPAVFFFLLAMLLLLRSFAGSRWTAVAAGVLFGLAHAMKWYYVAPWICLLCYAVYRTLRGPGRRPAETLFTVAALGALPLAVYAATYAAWFARGYDLPEFVQMQVDMFREMQAMEVTGFKQQLAAMGTPVQWFIRPMFHALPLDSGGPWPRLLVMMNNPPVWMLVGPSTAFLLFRRLPRQEGGFLLTAGLFAAVYVQFLLTPRPVFLYSSLTVLPFAFLIVAAAVEEAGSLAGRPKDAVRWVVICFLLWSVLTYPLATGKPSPAGLAGLFLPASTL